MRGVIPRKALTNLKKNNLFSKRHIGTNPNDREHMLQSIGFSTMDEFIDAVVPTNILKRDNIEIGEERTEEEVLAELKEIALKNKVYKKSSNHLELFLYKELIYF